MEFSIQKTKEAAGALQKYLEKTQSSTSKNLLVEESSEPDNAFYLNIITKKYASDKKNLKPKRIPVKHCIYPSPEELDFCLISKDPQRTYKDALLEKVPAIKRIIGVSKFKGKFKSYEAKRLLRSQHDIFLAEDAVVTTLPKLLGKVFYDSKKTPLSIQIGAKINADKVKAQVDAIINSTLLQLVPGTTLSIKIGYTAMSADQIAENADDVLKYFTEKVRPWTAIRSVQLKTPKSPSLPIFITDKLYDEKDVLADSEPSDKKRKREDKISIIEQAWEDILDDETLEEYKKKHKKTKGESSSQEPVEA